MQFFDVKLLKNETHSNSKYSNVSSKRRHNYTAVERPLTQTMPDIRQPLVGMHAPAVVEDDVGRVVPLVGKTSPENIPGGKSSGGFAPASDIVSVKVFLK